MSQQQVYPVRRLRLVGALWYHMRRCASGHLFAWASLLLLGACDGAGDALRRAFPATPKGDPDWMRDSAMIASKPEVLFRVLSSARGPIAVPIATMSARGLHELNLSDRGWRAFDVFFMHSTATLTAYRDGRATGPVTFAQGMWEKSAPLDSLPGCPRIVPAGRLQNAPGIQLATSGKRPPPKSNALLDASQLEEAARLAATLVAPTVGVSPAELAHFTREVHQVPGTATGAPSVVMVFSDPVPLPDTVSRYGQRARHIVVIVDKGVYGYRTSYVYSTVGVKNDKPRLKWVDYLDVDGDGSPEVFLGLQNPGFESYLIGLRFTVDAWQEFYRSTHARCAM